ncbi:MAG: lysophospholipid acyltransferase family protein [Thermoanaerobaculales bacterium]|nr:lysophospholipid acyltransferase family protein [Thermoanaerobaculales bacterium]
MPRGPLSARGGRLATLRASALLAAGFTTLLGFNLVMVASLLLLPFSRRACRAVTRWCADTWWGWCVSAAELAYGVRIEITGDDVPPRENALLIVNHQQMVDIPVLMKLARTKGRLGDMKYFIKREFKWFPGMGWGLQMLDAVFVARDWAADRERIGRTFARLVDGRVPMYLVSFAEGTRFTLAKLAGAQAYAREHGLPVPRHTLVPRTKGVVASIDGLRSHLDAVYPPRAAGPGGRAAVIGGRAPAVGARVLAGEGRAARALLRRRGVPPRAPTRVILRERNDRVEGPREVPGVCPVLGLAISRHGVPRLAPAPLRVASTRSG